MSESDPIDLSELQGLQFGPTWADKLAASESSAPGEVIWGKFEERPGRGGDRGPRRDGDRRPGGRGDGRGFERRGDNRGPRPDFRGGPGGGSAPGGPRRDGPPRGERRDGPRPAGGGENRGPRPGGENRGPRPEFRGGPGGERREGGPPRGGDRRDFKGRGRGGEGGRFDRDRRDDRREGPPPPLAGWEAKLLPEPRSVEAIARQIKASGRAFSVFDVGRLFMGSRERYLVQFSRMKARPAQPHPHQGKQEQQKPAAAPQAPRGPEVIYQCVADKSLWLTREEAIRHLLNSPAIEKYYRKEIVSVDAPKGNWSAVAVCGFSGALLGPPNHHDFQRNVARLHRERFSDMSLERYKSRIRTEKDEALMAKWQESQSSTTQWVPVTADTPAAAPAAEKKEAAAAPEADAEAEVSASEGETPAAEAETAAPQGPAPLKSQSEMEAHFLRTHAADAVVEVSAATVPGNIHGKCLTPPLFSLLRREVETQQRFPMGLVQDLCRELEGRGLRFFKRDKKATFVVRTRPHFLPDDLVLSDRVRSIVEMVRANPGITYTRLVGTLAPHISVEPGVTEAAPETPAAEAAPVVEAVAAEVPAVEAVTEATATAEVVAEAVTEAAPAEVAAESQPEAAAEDAAPAAETPDVETKPEAAAEEAAPAVEAPAPAAAPEAPAAPILSPEEIAILQDLRWLVNEGYVTEFAEGELFVLGRPPQPPQEKRERLPRQKPNSPAKPAAADAPGEAAAEPQAEAAPEAEAVVEAVEVSAAEIEAPAAVAEESAPVVEEPAPAAEAAAESSEAPPAAS